MVISERIGRRRRSGSESRASRFRETAAENGRFRRISIRMGNLKFNLKNKKNYLFIYLKRGTTKLCLRFRGGPRRKEKRTERVRNRCFNPGLVLRINFGSNSDGSGTLLALSGNLEELESRASEISASDGEAAVCSTPHSAVADRLVKILILVFF